jgi:hypothetical protein
MTIDPSVDNLLEGGAPGLKFPTIGTSHKGTIISAKSAQQRTIDGKPKFWDDGNPAMQLVITLQTDYRDAGPGDDGLRRLFANGGKLAAIRTALKGRKLEAGGELAIQYSGDGEPKPGKNAPKLYQAAYRPPAVNNVDALLGAPTAANLPTSFPDPAPKGEPFDPFAD